MIKGNGTYFIDMLIDGLNIKPGLSREEIVKLLKIDEPGQGILFSSADKLRKKLCGDDVHLRGVIIFSNYCEQNCLYCSMREDNFSVDRFRMSAEEIINAAKHLSNTGYKTIVLSSGEDSYYDTDIIAYIVYTIKQFADVAITLSLGARGFDEYRTWKIAGADRYLLKFESANPELYSTYNKKTVLHDRIQHLKYLKRIGYRVGSGSIVGLPNQTVEDIAEDILLVKKLGVDIASFTPFVPSPFTPYQNMPAANINLALKTLAVARLCMPGTHIISSTALDRISENGCVDGLNCGANVILSDLASTFSVDRKFRLNKNIVSDYAADTQTLEAKIEANGRHIATTKGDPL